MTSDSGLVSQDSDYARHIQAALDALQQMQGSSPSLRPSLSLATPGQYALSSIMFIAQTIRHPLDQFDLVVKSFGHPVAIAIPDIMGVFEQRG